MPWYHIYPLPLRRTVIQKLAVFVNRLGYGGGTFDQLKSVSSIAGDGLHTGPGRIIMHRYIHPRCARINALQPLCHLRPIRRWLFLRQSGLPGWRGRHLLTCCSLAGSFPFRFPSVTFLTRTGGDYDRAAGLCSLPIWWLIWWCGCVVDVTGFATIGPPGSLAAPPVLMNMLYWDFPSPGRPVSLLHSEPLSSCWVQSVVIEPNASVSMTAVDSLVESDLTGARRRWLLPYRSCVHLRLCRWVVVRVTGHCRRIWCGRTGHFIVPLIVRQAWHLPCILNLHSIHLCVRKDLLRRPTLTLELGTTRVVVPTGSRPTGFWFCCPGWTLLFTATPPTVPGVGGSARICPFIEPGPPRMDPVHVPVANHRRCATTITWRLLDDVKP